MISALGQRIASAFRRTAPDPFVIAVLLTLFTAVLALAFGFPGTEEMPRPDLGERAKRLLDVWGVTGGQGGGGGGIWNLLAFSMQMSLILVTGYALAASRPVRGVIDWLAGLPRSAAGAAGLVAAAACVTGVINWGLGLIVGALLAREVGRSLAARGIAAHYPLIAAAGYTGLLVWHGGFSGSAPLTSTTWAAARGVMPGGFVDEFAARVGTDGIALTETLLSWMNVFVTGGLLILVPVVFVLLTPRDPGSMRGFERCVRVTSAPAEEPVNDLESRPGAVPEWLERSPMVSLVLALAIVLALVRYGRVHEGLGAIGLNQINAAMLALGLIMHGSPRSYIAAVEEAARGCAGIIIQFPLYAGIMAMMSSSGLVRMLADAFLAAGNQTTIPLMSFLSAGVVNMFVPSGGGQWAIQGPIALQAGVDAGVDPAKMVMSVAYGDQLTNMLQPFWALPLLAITGVKARDIVGYTVIAMLIAGAWICLGLLLF